MQITPNLNTRNNFYFNNYKNHQKKNNITFGSVHVSREFLAKAKETESLAFKWLKEQTNKITDLLKREDSTKLQEFDGSLEKISSDIDVRREKIYADFWIGVRIKIYKI